MKVMLNMMKKWKEEDEGKKKSFNSQNKRRG